MHSSDMKDPTKYAGKRVVILGNAKSGYDAVGNMIDLGNCATVHHLMRKPRWPLPKTRLNVVMYLLRAMTVPYHIRSPMDAFLDKH